MGEIVRQPGWLPGLSMVRRFRLASKYTRPVKQALEVEQIPTGHLLGGVLKILVPTFLEVFLIIRKICSGNR
jgi:hypothetical protein